MKKFLLQRKGFTLIELLIVIVIIGILAVGFAPALLNAPKKARDGVRKGQIAGIKQAVDAYALDKNKYPATGCIDSNVAATGGELMPYFQGGALPQDQSVPQNDPNFKCTSGFYFLSDTVNACYGIITKLEVGPGNSKDLLPSCVSPIADGTDQTKTPYYAVTQKY